MLLVHFMYTHAVSLQIVTLVLNAMAAGEASQITPVQLCLYVNVINPTGEFWVLSLGFPSL